MADSHKYRLFAYFYFIASDLFAINAFLVGTHRGGGPHTRQRSFTSEPNRNTPSEPDKMGLRVGFVGAGQMAEALCRGFDAAGVAKCVDMTIIDRNQPRRDLFASWGCKIGGSNEEVVKNVDVVFISVKPYAVADLLREMKPFLGPHVLVVSIAAGVTLATMEDAAGANVPIMRVMPNTPCLVGCLAGAMSKGTACTPEHVATTGNLLGAVGKCHEVPESKMDAVTGVSGSGPAYIYQVIEAMADGGVLAGLPRAIAQDLAARTVMGAAKMVLETGKHPGELKDAVTSPAGTTIAAVHHLEKCGVRAAFQGAVKAAADRAHELSKS